MLLQNGWFNHNKLQIIWLTFHKLFLIIRTRVNMDEVVKRLGMKDLDIQEWLILTPKDKIPNPSLSFSHVRLNGQTEATSTNACLPLFKLSNRLSLPPEFRPIDTQDLSRNCSRSVRTKRSHRFQSTCPPSFNARAMAQQGPDRPRSSPRPVSPLWLEFTAVSVTLYPGSTHQTMSSSRLA